MKLRFEALLQLIHADGFVLGLAVAPSKFPLPLVSWNS